MSDKEIVLTDKDIDTLANLLGMNAEDVEAYKEWLVTVNVKVHTTN